MHRTCPVCGGHAWQPRFEAEEMFDGERFAVQSCDGCGLGVTDDELRDEDLPRYYRWHGEADAGGRFRGAVEPLMRALRRRRLRAVRHLGTGKGRALDVGCGRGVFLDSLAREGWQVVGTEIDPEVAASARERLGDRVHTGSLTDLDEPIGSFDLVTFWHVLEHLSDPLAAVERARDLLAPGGYLLIGVPNVDSWQARWFGRHWLHLDVPRHRWHFSAANLRSLGEQVGLRHVATDHFSFEYGPYGMFQSALAAAGLGHALFTRVLRPGRRRQLVREPSFWLHALLGVPVGATAALAFPVEALAAWRQAGGAITMTLQRQDATRT